MANFNINKSILGGRLTADPELKQTQTGIMVTSFTLAVNRRAAKEGEQQTADFINCVAWKERAEFICRYFRKGSSLAVVGRITTRSWTDAQNCKHYATEVIVDEAYFVDSKSEAQGGADGAQGANYMPGAYTSPPTAQNAPQGAQSPAQAAMAALGTAAPQFEVLASDEELPF